MRLWIDTDVGDDPDDAIALICAAAHSGIELVGVSTVNGDHARRVALAGALVDAPVVSGADPQLTQRVGDARADALLAIGPLTNVGRLLDAGALPSAVALMGGLLQPIRYRGGVLDVEYNIGCDPAAAGRVFRSCQDLLVTPLDVTARTALDAEQVQALLDAAPVLRPAITEWLTHADAVRLHDPLALLAVVGEPVVTTETRHLAVETDGRVVEQHDAPPQRLVVDADVDAAIARVLDLAGAP